MAIAPLRVLIATRSTAMPMGLTAILADRSNLSPIKLDPPLQELGLAEQIEELHPDVVLLNLDAEQSDRSSPS